MPDTFQYWHASPRSAVEFLLHAATLKTENAGPHLSLTMPGVSVTVGQQIDALRRLAGQSAVDRIRHEPNEMVVQMVSGWAENFDPTRAIQLGFRAEESFDEIIRIHMEDELDGNFVR